MRITYVCVYALQAYYEYHVYTTICRNMHTNNIYIYIYIYNIYIYTYIYMLLQIFWMHAMLEPSKKHPFRKEKQAKAAAAATKPKTEKKELCTYIIYTSHV